MTATEKLRCLLDERGVEYEAPNDIITMWAGNVCSWIAIEDKDGLAVAVNRDYLNPEQAIAATVGRGTCEADETETIKCWVKCKDEPSTERMELIHVMECSECGHTYEHVNGDYEFCPRCGRKRVNA